jgi:hypothetical protein
MKSKLLKEKIHFNKSTSSRHKTRLAERAERFGHRHLRIYRLLKSVLFASLVLSMAAATKKEKKRRSLPLEGRS